MKVGDLVRFSDGYDLENNLARYRSKGIILSFDKDDDPMVLWFDSSFFLTSRKQTFVGTLWCFQNVNKLFTPFRGDQNE